MWGSPRHLCGLERRRELALRSPRRRRGPFSNDPGSADLQAHPLSAPHGRRRPSGLDLTSATHTALGSRAVLRAVRAADKGYTLACKPLAPAGRGSRRRASDSARPSASQTSVHATRPVRKGCTEVCKRLSPAARAARSRASHSARSPASAGRPHARQAGLSAAGTAREASADGRSLLAAVPAPGQRVESRAGRARRETSTREPERVGR
jgi:hypothetical protein